MHICVNYLISTAVCHLVLKLPEDPGTNSVQVQGISQNKSYVTIQEFFILIKEDAIHTLWLKKAQNKDQSDLLLQHWREKMCERIPRVINIFH